MIKMKRSRATLIVLSMLAALTLGGCGEEQVTENANSVAVEAAAVELCDLQNSTVLSATLRGQNEVNIIPKAVNTVNKVYVEVGDTVKAGDVLIEIDSSALQVQLAQAQAQYAAVKSGADEAQRNYERMKVLYNEGAISLQQLESAKGAVDRSGLSAAAAGVQLVREQIANCVITSPIDGVVGSLNATVGQIASQTQPIAVVSDMTNMEMVCNVSESYVGKLQVGQSIEVVIKSIGDEPFIGTIETIAPAADQVTLSFPVKISIPNADGRILSGMFAEANMSTDKKSGVLAVEKSAVSGKEDKYVYVVDAENVAHKTAVEVGLETVDMVEIVSGVSAGDVVVTKGQHLLYDGAVVRVIK